MFNLFPWMPKWPGVLWRRFAGWLMGLQEPREPRPSIACSIGWHRPGELRIGGRYVPANCVERGCPIVTELLSKGAPDA
jgi:hypothetical protein